MRVLILENLNRAGSSFCPSLLISLDFVSVELVYFKEYVALVSPQH